MRAPRETAEPFLLCSCSKALTTKPEVGGQKFVFIRMCACRAEALVKVDQWLEPIS